MNKMIDAAVEPLCKNCKWWGADGDAERDSAICTIAGSDDGKPEHPESLAVAYDAEQYYASLRTSADFGCVQFEKELKHE